MEISSISSITKTKSSRCSMQQQHARDARQPTRTSLRPSIIIHWHSSPSILDLIIADNEVCLFLVQIDGDPLLPRYLTDKYYDDLQYMQVSYLHLLRKMKPLEQLMMKERLMANHVPMWDSKKVMKFVMRYSARKSA